MIFGHENCWSKMADDDREDKLIKNFNNRINQCLINHNQNCLQIKKCLKEERKLIVSSQKRC